MTGSPVIDGIVGVVGLLAVTVGFLAVIVLLVVESRPVRRWTDRRIAEHLGRQAAERRLCEVVPITSLRRRDGAA